MSTTEKTYKQYRPLFILSRNGWEWLSYEKDYLSTTDNLTQYKINILGDAYASTIVALIADHPDHLQLDGHYGVMWLEAIYENDRNGCLSYEDMEDMQSAIVYAEENLLTIGMPFTPDYMFHGTNSEEMKKRNGELRELYNMDELEEREGRDEQT